MLCGVIPCMKSCTYEGKTYAHGGSFASKDGCNTCTCDKGQVQCTEKACPPEYCGGSTGLSCREQGQYCAYPGGTCHVAGRVGICASKPKDCGGQDPHCGCDGKTYANLCTLANAGSSVAYKGECKSASRCKVNNQSYKHGARFPASDGCNVCTCSDGKVLCTEKACPLDKCGGASKKACPASRYCAYPVGACGTQAREGVCLRKPLVCPTISLPVCGCDDKTYANACLAAAAGTAVFKPGACSS